MQFNDDDDERVTEKRFLESVESSDGNEGGLRAVTMAGTAHPMRTRGLVERWLSKWGG